MNAVFDFKLDAAASPEDTKCSSFLPVIPSFPKGALDGSEWPNEGWIWCNPPYGVNKDNDTSLKDWCKAFVDQSTNGRKIVALLPNNTDTQWFHKHVLPHAKIVWIRGRLQFAIGDEKKSSNPGGNILAIYAQGAIPLKGNTIRARSL